MFTKHPHYLIILNTIFNIHHLSKMTVTRSLVIKIDCLLQTKMFLISAVCAETDDHSYSLSIDLLFFLL